MSAGCEWDISRLFTHGVCNLPISIYARVVQCVSIHRNSRYHTWDIQAHWICTRLLDHAWTKMYRCTCRFHKGCFRYVKSQGLKNQGWRGMLGSTLLTQSWEAMSRSKTGPRLSKTAPSILDSWWSWMATRNWFRLGPVFSGNGHFGSWVKVVWVPIHI